MEIKHVKHEKIDYLLWDKTIANSQNSMIYAFSWFLDCVSPQWEALISENYEFVMPLPVKTKFGLKYIVQPFLTQQLGVFSSMQITELIVFDFIRSIPYLSYEMNLNEKNYVSSSISLPNLMLNLNVTYENLVKKIAVNTLRNIRKAENYRLKMNWELNYVDFLQFFFEQTQRYDLPDKNITKRLVLAAIEQKKIQLLGVKSVEGKLLAVLGLFTSGNKLIYLLPSSSTKGKEVSAMFFMVNAIIKKYAGTNTILDFEGSKIDGVARFYKGFGAKPTSYYLIKRFRFKFLIGK